MALLAQSSEVGSWDLTKVVVLPQLVPAKGWRHLLHNQTARLLKSALIYGRNTNRSDRIIVDVPFHLRR